MRYHPYPDTRNRQKLQRILQLISLGMLMAAGCTAGGIERRPGEAPPAAQAARLTTPTEIAGENVVDPAPTNMQPSLLIPTTPSDERVGAIASTPAPDPLRFVYPTPKPPPVSAWRPPLYPVPWALSFYDHFYFIRPIAADEINWPNADYRYGGKFFDNIVHTGVDIPAPVGTPILAAGPGKVVWAGYGLYYGSYNLDDPYGLAVAIRHDFGYQGDTLFTVYGHMSRVDVVRGQWVQTGDPLGLVGVTGFTTGPHLHFEVRVGSNRFLTTRNPELWIAPPQGWGLLAGRVMNTSGRLEPQQLVYVKNQQSGQLWTVRSYGAEAANSDPYYQENLVMGDLPAGRYLLRIPFAGVLYEQEIDIKPGLVSTFTFRGRRGFLMESPPTPDALLTPSFP